jgi:phage/plasmid-like protein (TIGR03299 family)
MLAKLPKTIKTTRKDVTEGYIAITNAHDGSESWRLFVTLTRIVCNNTKTIALNNAGNDGITYRHTGGLPDRLEEAKAYLGIIDESMEKFETATKVMAKAKLKGGQLGDYAQALFPHDDAACAQLMNRMMDEQSERATIMRELLNGYERQTQRTRDENKAIFEMVMANHENERQGVAGRGTTWAAYNAVSEWVDHQRSSKSADQHFETVLTGKGDGIKTDAFDLAYAYAQNNTSAV